jgi:hypothetical protein
MNAIKSRVAELDAWIAHLRWLRQIAVECRFIDLVAEIEVDIEAARKFSAPAA